MLSNAINLEAGVFLGPEQRPNTYCITVTNAFGEKLQEQVMASCLYTRKYGDYPSTYSLWIDTILEKIYDRIMCIYLNSSSICRHEHEQYNEPKKDHKETTLRYN